ncbi:MAG: hypothetical protein ACI8P0_003979 [Planctomycetaceae bacterium]|jgi:hypothetical protein
MKPFSIMIVATLLLASLTSLRAAEPPAEFIKAGEERREEIPLGGDFRPAPKSPVLVAVGHGARILLSRDDGKTWKQVFWGNAGMSKIWCWSRFWFAQLLFRWGGSQIVATVDVEAR